MGTSFTTAPLNPAEPLVDSQRRPTTSFIEIWTSLTQAVDDAPARVESVNLSAQGAAISTTPIPTAALSSGLYRLSWYIRITRAATTNSSVTLTLSWTDGGVTVSASGSAITGNTTSTFQSDTLLVRIDGATPVSYAVAYSSSGGTSAQFSLDLVLEQIEA